MKDSPNLDLLRSIAVGLVVGGHLALNLQVVDPAVFDFDVMGRVGVAVFFVHTSLVLMQSLGRTGPSPLPFYVRRVFRVYPLSMVAVLLTASAWISRSELSGLASNLFLVQNLTGHASMPPPLWSLPYEVQMYLLLPTLYLLSLRCIAAFWLASVAGIACAWAAGWNASVFQYLPCFLPGVLASLLPRAGRSHPALLVALVGIASVAVPLAVAQGLPELPLLWSLCLALGLLIPHSREIKQGAIRRGAKLVVTYSYGMYVTHWLALLAAFSVAAPLPAQIILFVGCLGVLSYASYRFVEQPGIALGKQLADAVTARESRRRGLDPAGPQLQAAAPPPQ